MDRSSAVMEAVDPAAADAAETPEAILARRRRFQRLLRNFAIELVIYGILVALYAAFALQYLSEPLHHLFDNNRPTYAVVALALMVAQAIVLEWVTSFLVERLRLERLH